MNEQKKENFLVKLFETHRVSCYYHSLSFAFKKQQVVYNNNSDFEIPKKSFSKTIIAFPKFLVPLFQTNNLRIRRIQQRNIQRYGIVLNENLLDINSYLQKHFSKNSRSPILKKKKRLESCFNISHVVYFGNIDMDTYQSLMEIAKKMLIERFKQRSGYNFALNRWEKYRNSLFNLVNEHKASFFVIYNNDSPIQISINYHFNTILFAHIPAYDINYSKFGLGNTAVYKQLEWCIANKYSFLDFGEGYLESKRRWCNYEYQVETHIICDKNNLLGNAFALFELNLVKLKNLMKALKIDLVYQYFKYGKNAGDTSDLELNYSFLEPKEPIDLKKIDKIDFQSGEFDHLKKGVYDFLFQYQEHLDKISVYRKNNNTYLFFGENTKKEVYIEE